MATKKTGSVGSSGTFGVSSTKTAVSNSKKTTETQRKNQSAYNTYENTQKLINDAEQKALADAQAKQEQQLAESKAAYEAQYNAYMSQIQQQAAAQKAYYQQMYDENAANINQNYDRSANTAYIQYRQGQKELPEQLSNLGATGGASESANIRLQSEYGTNLANNEYARNSDIAMAKPITSIYTMKASNWSDSVYSFDSEYPKDTYDIEISLSSTATDEQGEAFDGAMMLGVDGTNTVKCRGTVPTIDIPVVVRAVKK